MPTTSLDAYSVTITCVALKFLPCTPNAIEVWLHVPQRKWHYHHEKNAKVEHKTSCAKYVEHVTNYPKFPLDQKLVSERFHMKIDHHHWFFCWYYPFVNDCGTQKCFVEDAMLYVIHVFYHSKKFHVHVVPNGGFPIQEHIMCLVWLKKSFQRIDNLSM
jgi:hypothetical protein